ncbi:MAG: hypothetical protein ACAI34_03735 [Verrucomicrobium sp.]
MLLGRDAPPAASASETSAGGGNPAPSEPAQPATPPVLPDETVAQYQELGFKDLYVTPAGPRGLEFTDRVRSLAGQRVRMTGHMVRLYHDDPRIFLFTELPTSHDQREYGLADSLPVSLMHVEMKVRPGDAPAWLPRKITVYGVLETGPKQEVDGRISHLRLLADHVTEAKNSVLLELRKPLILQRDRMRSGQKPPL